MANFSNIKITRAGAALITSAITEGKKIVFSHIAVGDGELREGQDIDTMTELISPVLDLPIDNLTNEGDSVLVTATISTASVKKMLLHRELGVCAGDTLVAYGNAGDEYDAIPSTGSSTALSKKIKVRLNIASGSTTFRDLESDEFVTHEALASRMGEVLQERAEAAAKTAVEEMAATGAFKGDKGDQGEQGERGTDGVDGVDGKDGRDGVDGVDGKDGKSAYDEWLENGHEGTVEDFFVWLAEALGIDLHFAPNSAHAQSGMAVQEAVDTHSGVMADSEVVGHVKVGGNGIGIDRDRLVLLVRSNHSGIAFDEKGHAYLNTGTDEHPAHGSAPAVTTDSENMLCVVGALTESDIEEKLNQDITSTYFTEEGTDNAEFSWFMLAANHVPTGYLTRLSIKCRSGASDTMTSEACYLGLWEEGDTEDSWNPIGTSTEAISQVAGQESVWDFNYIPLSGKPLRICLLSPETEEQTWGNDHRFAARITPNAACGSIAGLAWDESEHPWLPQLTMSVQNRGARFAPASHVHDADMHISPDERARWETSSPSTYICSPEGTEDYNYTHADIPAKYIPAGKLESIILQGGRENTNAYTQPAFLVVYQEQTPGSDNFQFVAVSTNAVLMEANKAHEWLFDKPVLLNERIRFYLQDTNATPTAFSPQHQIRSRVIETPIWQEGHVFTISGTDYRLPELKIKMAIPADKYVPATHESEWWKHLSFAERMGLTELLARKDEILSLIPSTATLELTDNMGQTDNASEEITD